MANPNFPGKAGRYEIKPVTIETVDQAVFDYFDKKIRLSVDASGVNKKVPILFATGERWKTVREKKGIRDENKTLILPLLTIQRLDIDRTPGFNSFGQEVPSITISSQIHGKTQNLQNQLKQRRLNGFPQVTKDKVVREYFTLPTPDYATVYYQVLIWTQYTEHMNEILEKIFHSYDYKDSFVLPVDYDGKKPLGNSYYFVGFRDGNLSSQSNFEEFTDQERIIRYTYNIKVSAFFILDPKDTPLSYGKNIQGSRKDDGKNVVYKSQNSVEIKFAERVSTLKEFLDLFGDENS